MSGTDPRAWLGSALSAGLRFEVISAGDVLATATPFVLADALPPDRIATLLAAALDDGGLTPASVLELIGADVLATHLAPALTWSILDGAVEASGLLGNGGEATSDQREFLDEALSGALAAGLIDASDVIAHATPAVLAEHLPVHARASLLERALAAGAMTPEIVLDTVGSALIAEHVPASVVWSILRSAAPSDDDGATLVSTELPVDEVPMASSDDDGVEVTGDDEADAPDDSEDSPREERAARRPSRISPAALKRSGIRGGVRPVGKR